METYIHTQKKKTQIVKAFLQQKKAMFGDLAIPELKLHYKARVITQHDTGTNASR